MQVAEDVRERHEFVFDVVRDLLGNGAVRIAGEDAVEVEVVDRGDAAAGHGGGVVGRGEQDDPAGDVGRFEGFGEIAEGDLAFILVAVVAGHEEGGRASPIADHHDGDGDEAVGRGMGGVKEAEVAVLDAVFVEIDLGEDAGDAGHAGFEAPLGGAGVDHGWGGVGRLRCSAAWGRGVSRSSHFCVFESVGSWGETGAGCGRPGPPGPAAPASR